ncbi:hypothetical protein PRJBM_00828 [Bartonella henselae]|nr:hypothetical protein Q653_01425 [Bartonella henselae JK 42]ETS08522.1 hypothetical protein Q655_00788 [Bartonella henselae JK 51]ETS09069.1 hypothetical protein Q654_00835 [Bartonella henselae JK 50]ETS12060.1 hypothetical protein Q652_01400 [Bartonella henselae JK 41]KEC56359.1 hypothetical protein O97_01326 [Bartonella henselae str. Zeus]KEC59061.1 hypothetical protein O95_01304 [Bartonella henselae JK 53]CDO40209.1 hypothetical protein PRJBM_00828 [Bartonella henselae]
MFQLLLFKLSQKRKVVFYTTMRKEEKAEKY